MVSGCSQFNINYSSSEQLAKVFGSEKAAELIIDHGFFSSVAEFLAWGRDCGCPEIENFAHGNRRRGQEYIVLSV